jgi:hypothetical protein
MANSVRKGVAAAARIKLLRFNMVTSSKGKQFFFEKKNQKTFAPLAQRR